MEKSLTVEENYKTSDSDHVSKSVGSSIKIGSISIDLVSNDETDAGECEHFSIRGYVSEIRKKNWKACWPFALDGNHDRSEKQTCPLPPLHVSKSRWWRCQNCLQELVTEGITSNHGNAFDYCNSTRLKSSGTCSHVSSPVDATMLQPDFQQAPKLNILEGGKVDASIASDRNDNECHPSCADKKDKNSESAKKFITGLELGSEDNLNQEVSVSGAATGVISGPVVGRHHTDDIGKQPSAEEHSEVMIACGTSSVAGIVGEVLDAVKSHTSELPFRGLDEHDNASSESAKMLAGNDLQDYQHDNSNGSHHRKTRKLRLLTELLAEKGDASTKLTRNENFPSNSVPEASAGVDGLSASQGMVAIKRNTGLDQNKKRKFPNDEEWVPLETSTPNNLYKRDGTYNEGAENIGTFASSGSEEDGGVSLQIGQRSHLNKLKFDKVPTTGKKKNKNILVVDECIPLASSQENVPKDIQWKAGDANKASAAHNTVLLKSGQTAFTGKVVYTFPFPPQKMEKNSSVCKKKSKAGQFDDGQASLNPWSSCVLRESPLTRKDLAISQIQSLPDPFLSAQNASTEKGLHHSLGSCLPTHGYDRNHISPLEDRLLIWQGSTSKQNQVFGREIQTNYVGPSNFPSNYEPNAYLRKGVHSDLGSNTYRMSFLDENQKSTHQVGNSSLMQQMDFCGTSNNGKSTERQEHSAHAKRHSDQQADKVSEQGVPDDIPMEIVELMAKNQYERCLPDIENDKQPLGTTINANNGQMYVRGKLRFLSENAAHKRKSGVKNSRNGKIARAENVGTTKQKSVECVSYFDGNQFNFSQPEQTYVPTGLKLTPQCQGKLQSGVKISPTSSSMHSSSQNCQWIGNIVGHRSSQMNLQTLESCNTCLSVPQQGKESASIWPSMVQNHMPFAYKIPQKHAGPSTSTDVFSHCPSSLRKGNLNGNIELNFLNLNVSSPEKHHRNMDSQTLSKNTENRFACKHSVIGSLDLYSNETIPAMHLLSLMDAGLPSGPPIDIDGMPKIFKRPSFPQDHHAKDFSGMSSGGSKTNSTMKFPSCDFYVKNHLSENSRDCFHAIPSVDASGYPFQYSKGAKKSIDLIGQASLKSQEREKAKGCDSTSQNKGRRSHKSVLTVGSSGTNHGSIPIPSMPKMFLGASDSMVFPVQPHVMENASKHKLEALNNTSTILPLKSSSKTEICSVNRNPADFSSPGKGNFFMINGEDLKFRKPFFSENRSGLIKLDRHKNKRLKKATAVKGKV